MTSTIQLRVDSELGKQIKARAAREKMSANKWLVKAINAHLEQEKEREWRVGFEAMGRDPDTNTVEYAFEAQQEIVNAD